MGNVTNLKQGSKGDDVVKLQNALIDAGYDVGSTGADGSFGPKTLAAVKQYQKDNGLQVDGIAGKNTLGALYGSGNQNANNANNGSKPAVADPVKPAAVDPVADVPAADAPAAVDKPNLYGNMTEEGLANYNNLLTQAFDTINQIQASRPGAYQFGADYGLANDYLNQYQNRDPFSYDFNSDALYNQYKDQYIQQGQMAMMDTMGQAAAMTGGYGNSYAQSVGQQTYNQYLGQLNEVMPELYGMAYDRYNQEGQDMLNMYSLYMDREQDNYNKYLDTVDMWNSELAQAKDYYNTLYGEYTDAYDQNYLEKQDAKEWEYKETQDAKADKNTNYNKLANLAATGYEPSKEELDAAGMTQKEYDAIKTASTSSTTGTGANNTTKYSDLGVGTQTQWDSYAKKADTWNGLADVWGRMKIAGHDPIDSAEYIMQWATKNDGAKPTYDELLAFGDTLEKAGVSEDDIKAFIYEWQNRFGLVEKNPSLSGLLGWLPTMGANIASGVGDFFANIKNGASK